MKLKKSDAYQVCRELNELCHCESIAGVPCAAVHTILTTAMGDPDLAIKQERERMAQNVANASSDWR